MPLFTWTLSGPVAVSPLSPPPSLPPIIGSAVSCDAEEFTQEDLLGVLERSYPYDYFEGMRRKPSGGFELFQAASKVGERVSIAIGRRYCCSFVISAPTGAKSTGQVELYRENADAGIIRVLPGTRVRASGSGKDFVTLEPIIFSALDLGPHTVDIEALAQGYEYDVLGAAVTARGELIPGEIDTVWKPILADGNGDPAIDLALRVRNTAPTSGGEDACLDSLGLERGIPREPGEDFEVYRARILNTPDAISPNAIRRGVNGVLKPLGYTVCLREVGTPLLPGFSFDAGGRADPPETCFAYDMDFDLQPEDRFKVWLSYAEMRGFFLVGVPRLEEQLSGALVFDDTDLLNAYDTVDADQPNAAYDAPTLLQNEGVYGAVYETVLDRVAGGVGFELYVEDVGCF